jgi:hypothetical protein
MTISPGEDGSRRQSTLFFAVKKEKGNAGK